MGKKIICIGDSNTYGYEPGSIFGGRYPQDVRWTGLLARDGHEVVNLGANGMAVPERESFGMIRNRLSGEMPADVILAMLGTNDVLLNGAAAKETAEKMAVFLSEAVLPLHKEGRVVLISPLSLKEGTWVQSPAQIAESRLLGAEYKKAAEAMKISFADADGWGVETASDGVHFTAEGHRTFAEHIRKIVAEETL